MRLSTATACLILLLAGAHFPLHAQDQGRKQAELENSCRNFVQEFYGWYARGFVGSHPDLLERAIKYRRSAFGAELLRQIKDSRERAWSNEEVWLDFEPILNTQDPSQHYLAGEVELNGEDTCLVKIHAMHGGDKQVKPAVIPELRLKHGQWLFVNFHYPNSDHPDNENLVAMLKKILNEPKQPSALKQ